MIDINLNTYLQSASLEVAELFGAGVPHIRKVNAVARIALRNMADAHQIAGRHESITTTVFSNISWTNGDFGLAIYPATVAEEDLKIPGSMMARCGFDLSDLEVICGHTPQTINPDKLFKNEKQLLHIVPEWRVDPLIDIVTLAAGLGLQRVRITGPRNHPNYLKHNIDLEKGEKIIAAPARAAGFIEYNDGDFYYEL